jgi:hypothetical protein
VILGAGVALMVTGIAWATSGSETTDGSFEPRVAEPAFSGRLRPQVIIDGAHYNMHTASGSYGPFATLLQRDGYSVRASDAPLSSVVLARRRILVVANALGVRGVLYRPLSVARLERILPLPASAISRDEIAVVEAWVRGGGALLLVADDAPAGEAARSLAAAFGVEMTDWRTVDEHHHDPVTGNWSFLVFSRANGLLQDHPIAQGRQPTEQVHRVMTFTGQALRAPAGAAPLLSLSPTARASPDRRSDGPPAQSAAGLAQAVALQHGLGRVVVVGDADALTARTSRLPNGTLLRFGMSRSDTDNRQFVLNVLHWLSGLF